MPRTFGSNTGPSTDKARVFLLLGAVVIVVFLGIVGVFLISGNTQVSQQQPVVVEAAKELPMKMVDVLVPVKNIDAGAALEPTLFRKESRPQVSVSPRVVRDFEEIQNQFARSLILAGQPLHKDYVTSVRPVNAITANIPEGYRAVTISVDARSAVEGWVRPGARVDVVWVSNVRGQTGVTVIVQNASVLSAERQTDARVNPGDPLPSTVTLLVTSQDAVKIQLAQSTGSLTLQLRGDNDPGKGTGSGNLVVSDLLGANSAVGPSKNCQGHLVMGGVKYCVKSDGSVEPDENR